jgi:hypothetical protein
MGRIGSLGVERLLDHALRRSSRAGRPILARDSSFGRFVIDQVKVARYGVDASDNRTPAEICG